MKKALSLILTLAVCLCLYACGSHNDTNDESNTNNNGNTTSSYSEAEGLVLYREEYGYSVVNSARINELIATVELTVENWKEYLSVSSYTKKSVQTDAFDEVVSTEISTVYYLGAKNDQYCNFRNVVIELKDKQSGDLLTYRTSGADPITVEEFFDLDQYECTRIKGTLYLIDVPEAAIFETKDGARGFNVGFSDLSYGPDITCFLSGHYVGASFDVIVGLIN